jgi:hypothetical protein
MDSLDIILEGLDVLEGVKELGTIGDLGKAQESYGAHRVELVA